MSTPFAFRSDSARNPFASIEVRHATPRDSNSWAQAFIHDLRLLAAEKRMDAFGVESRGVR